MYLNELFKEAPNILIEQISCDSRLPMKNCIFFCMSGVKYDGHDYIQEAVNNGAKVIVYTKDIETNLDAIFIKVKNIHITLSNAAKKLYNYDSNKMKLFVTCGCYGKSTVSSFINQIIKENNNIGSIGAYGINYHEKHLTYPSSTLTLLDNYRYLSDMQNAGLKYCTLEANALSLSHNKLEGLYPNVFIYTSTSQFSKDYKGFSHKYFDSLRKYLYTLEESTSIILNRDDASYDELFQACSNNIVTYGFDSKSTYVISNPKYYIDHTTFDLSFDGKTFNIISPLISIYHVYDLVAAICAINETKTLPIDVIIGKINSLNPPEGIMEKLNIKDKNIIVDYCYSFDSYAYIKNFVKELKDINKIYIIMSLNYDDNFDSISSYFNQIKDFSFLTIFTENMIYDKDIHDLLDEASKCCQGYKYLTIEDRTEAIKTAVDLLDKNDLLLILGKGNSRFLNKNYNKIVYDGDKNVVINYLKSISV